MRKQAIYIVLLSIGLTACKKGPPPPPPTPAGIVAARAKLVSALKDPGSVQWRNEIVGTDGATLCGEFNSKNSMGGYVGFTRFIANPSGYLIAGGRFDTWSMPSNRIPVPESHVKAAEYLDSGTATFHYSDVFEWFWGSNCV